MSKAFDWSAAAVSALVKVKENLSLSYGFNQISDEGLGSAHDLWSSLSCLKAIFSVY